MKFTRKEFLNDSAEETGFIVVKCISPREEDLETYWAKNPSCDAEIQIGDCSKKVFLDCSVHKDSDVAKRVAKINVLIDNLTLLRDQLSPTWEDAKKVAQKWLEDNEEKSEFLDNFGIDKSEPVRLPGKIRNVNIRGTLG